MLNKKFATVTSVSLLFVALNTIANTSASLAHAQNNKVRVAQTWVPNIEYGGLWVAIENGYFDEEGLNVDYIPGGPNATRPEIVVASGNAEIGYTNWIPFLDAVARGNDFVMLAATLPVSPLGIISLPGKPILAAQDMAGSRILAQRATEREVVNATFTLNDLEAEWESIPTGFSPEPLLAGDGDGYTAFETNQVITLEMMGLERDEDFHFVLFDELGFTSSNGVLFTTRDYLEEERESVIGFMRALTRGWIENEQDPDAAVELVVNNFGADLGLDPEQQRRQNETQIQLMRPYDDPDHRLLTLDKAVIAGPMYDAARASGREELPNVDQIVDTTIMQEVHESLR
ncbi:MULTISPECIES: ABC transporter substrate-binding protein [Halomonadaceae]|uniref:ABC transporter substrate-binding protein n=1 Tax=Halomonadaceae TaxID=28256 RepID=UPI00159AE098|nr:MULTISPECIES: ABC transporter substrate-binding protein [Halomonas]QJQ94839.1 ABC transporter substrate-binding protein [Halomonas sp. PA5]